MKTVTLQVVVTIEQVSGEAKQLVEWMNACLNCNTNHRKAVVEQVQQVDIKAMEAVLRCAESHVEDVESGLEEGIYERSENPDIGQKQEAVRLYSALIDRLKMAQTPIKGPMVKEVMIQDIVGDYEDPAEIEEWDWIQKNASFKHTSNGDEGVWEWMLNLSRNFYDIPVKLVSVLESAKVEGYAYVLFHQGT